MEAGIRILPAPWPPLAPGNWPIRRSMQHSLMLAPDIPHRPFPLYCGNGQKCRDCVCTPGYNSACVFPGVDGGILLRRILRVFGPVGWLLAIRDGHGDILNNSAGSGCNDFDDIAPQIHELFTYFILHHKILTRLVSRCLPDCHSCSCLRYAACNRLRVLVRNRC